MGTLPTIRTTTQVATLGSGPSILGDSPLQIPTGGTIRSGIMVLTKAFAQNPKARAIYERGMAAGMGFKQINDQIRKEMDLQKNPMTPQNVPYFSVRRADFPMPEIADAIMAQCAEDRGQGVQLYRFPVAFPVDQWLAVLPHEFAAYTASQKVYWSEYRDGNRYCMTRVDIPVDPRAKRARKTFGGRPVVIRQDNGSEGLCEPNACREFASGACALAGKLVFFIPGIPGSKPLALPTRSIYSLKAIREQLELVAFMRGGRISGLHQGQPLFWVTKRQEDVPMIDPETGKSKRVRQWLITLESTLDVTALMDRHEALEASGARAAAMLSGPIAADDAIETVSAEDDTGPVILPTPDDKQRQAISSARHDVLDGVNLVGIDVDDWKTYAVREWGDGWGRDLPTLRKARDILSQAVDDEEARAALLAAVSEAAQCPF